jgi:CxxC motif-containing protein
LNKDNIALRLSQHGLDDELVLQFMNLLNDCEFERYAPIEAKEAAMENMFDSTVKIISTLENTIK